jgi:hypothetical protein
MVVIVAVLLLISLALIVRSRLDKTQRINWGYFLLGMAVWFIAVILTIYNDYLHSVVIGLPWLFLAISHLFALPILRSGIIPPYIRVKRSILHWFHLIIPIILFIALIVYFLMSKNWRASESTIFGGSVAVYMITVLLLDLFVKVEVCGNGVWQFDGLRPWDEYKSFSWGKNIRDSVELRLVSKHQAFRRSTPYLVSLEDREAVRQILEPNLPEQPITIDK